MEGLKIFFSQNDKLAKFLLNTGDTKLLECCPKDKYWEIRIGLRNPKIWTDNTWASKAQNQLGNLLMEVRRELRLSGTGIDII